MCVAELNVSLNPCQHRWYHLLRPCIPGSNLISCPGKLAIEGWEIRCDFCPFCSGWPLANGEFMQVGGHPHSRSSSISTPLSRTPSLTTSVAAARRDSRRNSLARTESNVSFSPVVYTGSPALGSPVHSASERNKAMNSRVDSYFEALPENVIEVRGKRSGAGGGMWANVGRAEDVDEDENDRRGSASTTSSASANVAAKAEAVTEKAGKAWRKAKRRSKDFTSFFR